MNQRSILRALSVACVGLIFVFMAETVEAQRGGGRGGGGRGGGGRSISRSGPASGGSFRTSGASNRSRASTMGGSRATTRPATRPSTQPSTRPATPTTRPSTGAGQTRPGTSDVRPSQRPGEGTRPERPNQPDGSNREDWQDHNNQAREDWQDFYEEGGGGSYYYGGYSGHYHVYDYHEEDDDWAILIAGMAIGTALTSASFSSMQTSTKCSLSEVTVNGVRYYKCGSTWYNRVIDGTNVNYVIVSAPAGY